MLNTLAAHGFAMYLILLISHTIYSNPCCFCHHATPIPVNLAAVVPWTEVILSNLVVTLKVFDPNVIRQEYCLNSTVTNVIGSEIMHEHDQDEHRKDRVLI